MQKKETVKNRKEDFGSLAHCFLHSQQLGSVVHNQRLLGERHLLELLSVRGRDLGTGDTGRRSLKVVEAVLAGKSQNFSADTEGGEVRSNGNQVAGLLDGLDDGLDIQGLDGTKVDHLSLDAVLLLELLGSSKRLTDAARNGNNGKVLAGALNLGLAKLQDL